MKKINAKMPFIALNVLKKIFSAIHYSFFFSLFFSFLFVSLECRALDLKQFTEKVQKNYEALPQLQMDFQQSTYVALLEKNVRREGKIILQKPGKFRISYLNQPQREYISNGSLLWVYRKGDQQVKVLDLSDENVPAEALSFLTGLGRLNQEFVVEEVDQKKWEQLKEQSLLKKTQSQKSLQWMLLTPRKKLSQIEWLVMGFDGQDFIARELFILNESGNLSHYVFENIQKEGDVKADTFQFHESGVKEVKVTE